jgi:hypothetical protein
LAVAAVNSARNIADTARELIEKNSKTWKNYDAMAGQQTDVTKVIASAIDKTGGIGSKIVGNNKIENKP